MRSPTLLKWSMNQRRRANCSPMGKVCGVTLLELLITMALLALVATLGYGGLLQVQRVNARVATTLSDIQRLQFAFSVCERDVSQAAPRSVLVGLAGAAPMFIGGASSFEFTRGGLANPAGARRSGLQRVAYGFELGQLFRSAWSVLDRPSADTVAKRRILLPQVDKLELRYLNSDGRWLTSWTDTLTLPRAVEVNIESAGLGRLRRVLKVTL